MSVRDRPGIARPRTATSGVGTIRAALSMLTRIPVGAADDDDTGAAAYGLVGALVGAIAAIPVALLAGAAPTLAAIVAVGTLAIVSGGLHLDGLADTADALLAPDRIRAEAARKDPAVGSGGVVALVLVLAAQVAALASVMTIGRDRRRRRRLYRGRGRLADAPRGRRLGRSADEAPRPDSAPGSSPASGRSMWLPRC